MAARSLFAALIDHGVRDTAGVQKTCVRCFAIRPVPPSSAVDYCFDGLNIPIFCNAVRVNPRDIIVADNDVWSSGLDRPRPWYGSGNTGIQRTAFFHRLRVPPSMHVPVTNGISSLRSITTTATMRPKRQSATCAEPQENG